MAQPLPEHIREAQRGEGWQSFAGAMLMVGGGFKLFDALWAFKYDGEVTEQVQTVVFENDLESWGWVWLVAGIMLIGTGVAVVLGAQWARWLGIVVSVLAILMFLPWIYYKPLWTILSVTIGVLGIYALAAYGGHDWTRTRART